MIKLVLLTFGFFLSVPASALVTSPGSVIGGKWNVESRATLERGKLEPNENSASFQAAKINVVQLSIARTLSGLNFGQDHFLRLDYRYFTSNREAVGGQVFYDSDRGHVATLSFGLNVVHELSHSAGVYVSVSPLTSFNRNKFSNPRVDLWALGFRSGVQLGSDGFLEGSVHFGSGIPGKQNYYLAFTQLFGLKATDWATVKFGPYAELDLQERADAAYDSAFSAPGRSDRIRSAKVGVSASADFSLSAGWYVGAGYVQKLGGYDAPATNATHFSVGTHF